MSIIPFWLQSGNFGVKWRRCFRKRIYVFSCPWIGWLVWPLKMIPPATCRYNEKSRPSLPKQLSVNGPFSRDCCGVPVEIRICLTGEYQVAGCFKGWLTSRCHWYWWDQCAVFSRANQTDARYKLSNDRLEYSTLGLLETCRSCNDFYVINWFMEQWFWRRTDWPKNVK